MRAIRTVVTLVLSGMLIMSGPSMANTLEYNSGFLAAESGDYKTAMQKWGPLAEKGNPLAQFNLAMLFHSGSGVPQSEAQAMKWYTAAAENGYYRAQEYLAIGYAEGWFGFKVDRNKAHYWEQRIDSGK